MKPAAFILFGVLGIAVAGVTGLIFWSNAPAANAPADDRSSQGSQPSLDSSIRKLEGQGYIEPASEIRRLAFKSDGIIASCPVQIGQRVKAGEPLMILEHREETAAVAVAEKELELARAERDQLLGGVNPHRIEAAQKKVDALKAEIRLAQIQRDRAAKLFDRKTITLDMRDRAETSLAQTELYLQEAEAELMHLKQFVRPADKSVAEAKVQLTEARLQTAREHLANSILSAPMDGTVLEILKLPGEAHRLVNAEPVMIIADLHRLRVRAEMDERYAYLFKAGQMAQVHGRGLGDTAYSGRVSIVKSIMGQKTVFARTAQERKDLDVLQLWIDMDSDFQAPIGLRVDVSISVQP